MLSLLHVNIVLYSVCFGLVVPILPYIVDSMGVEAPHDTLVYGYLQTTYSILQLIGAPIVGIIGDKYGTKYALIVSFAASAINYFILGSATSIEMVFLSRVPALLQHALLASQSYISDTTPENERSKRIGRVSLSFGVGVVIGPAIGGIISKSFSYSAVAYVASLISVVNTLLLFMFMEDPPARVKKTHSHNRGLSVALIYHIFNNKNILGLLVLRVAVSLPSAIFHAISPIITKTYFELDASKNGMVMSYVGIMMAIAQGLVVGQVSQRFKDHTIMFGAIIAMAIVSMMMLMVTDIIGFMILLGPLICSGAVLNTVISSTVTKSVDPSEVGRILGVDTSLSSSARVIAPTVGSYLYIDFGGYTTVLYVNIAMFLLAATWTKLYIFPTSCVK